MMKKKYLSLALVLVVGLLFSVNHFDYSADSAENNTFELNVSGIMSYSVENFIEQMDAEQYFDNCDKNTVQWLSTLKGNEIFFSPDYYVVMNKTDAELIPLKCATDISINDTIRCEVVENHSLGDSYKNIIYVRNVEFLNQSIYYYE